MEKEYVKELTKMDEDFVKWYTDIVVKAELVDYAPMKGFMVIRPYGFAIWENIQKEIDVMLKQSGHQNAYFPLLIPESMLNIEKNHVEGFAPEVAWVTRGGEAELQERLCIRPTSETMICTMFSKWIHSYRDLPLLINQWANVVRWEKTTRPFLRTTEFLWQEGHTLHETEKEAICETLRIIDMYEIFYREYLSIPVIKGLKSNKEKFAGAIDTYTIEALMHDGKALQSATSHYFGDGFSKAFNIKYQGKDSKEHHPYQTSWGLSTRTIGGIIMTHGDDRGLKLPPKIAPTQIIIVPFAQNKEGVIDKVYEIKSMLNKNYRVDIDIKDNITPGYKCNHYELRGVPVRIEVGPKDIENNECVVFRRDTFVKTKVKYNELVQFIDSLLKDIQKNMYTMALKNREEKTYVAKNLDEYLEIVEEKQGFIKIMWCGSIDCENKLKELTSATFRCIPFIEEHLSNECTICGNKAKHMVYTAKQY